MLERKTSSRDKPGKGATERRQIGAKTETGGKECDVKIVPHSCYLRLLSFFFLPEVLLVGSRHLLTPTVFASDVAVAFLVLSVSAPFVRSLVPSSSVSLKIERANNAKGVSKSTEKSTESSNFPLQNGAS